MNNTAPYFSLPDQDGKQVSLSDFRGKWLVLYFYPKDETPACTKEACTFRDNYSEILELGAEVLGVSKDNQKSHKKFASHHKLNFKILSDDNGEVIKAYGAWGEKKLFGKTFTSIRRNTYLISPSGVLVKEYTNVKPASHIKQIVEDLKTLSVAY